MTPLRNLVQTKTYRDTPLGKDEVVAIFKQLFSSKLYPETYYLNKVNRF